MTTTELGRLVQQTGARVVVVTPRTLVELEADPAWPAVRDQLAALGAVVVVADAD